MNLAARAQRSILLSLLFRESATFLLFIRFKGSVFSLSPALCIRNSQFGSAMRPLRSTLVSSLRVARRELASDTKFSQLKIKKYLLSMLVRLSLFHFPSSHLIQPDMVPTLPRLFLNTHIYCKTLFIPFARTHFSLALHTALHGFYTRASAHKEVSRERFINEWCRVLQK